ncbi:cyclic GMP-AMP synthase-like receptor [Drosophila montana]|uniref:cyclic GMP-AMP synthase-like receptor n=1 Tax=Drosophila montana TaxID=40370 RepID=UPI00313E08E7
MSNFEFCLQEIADDIRNPNDSTNANDFFAVKDYVLSIMRDQDSYFRKICQNDILFGSMAHDVRLYNDDELDVLMELRFPAYSRIEQVEDEQHPGMVFLDFSDACLDNMVFKRLANNKWMYMNRYSLKRWLHNIFVNALDNYGNVVYGDYDEYTLDYKWRGITYTITAESPSRIFHIDFVPAVKIVRPKSGTWHAIPKYTSGNTHNFTFMISNAQAELQHVERCGQALRDALRLLQALRNAKQLWQLRCYHFVTLAIWMARRDGYSKMFHLSVSELFLMLLSDLCDAFLEGHLPYVWNSQMNLLGNFTDNEMSQYTSELCDAYNVLDSYSYKSTVSFARCLRFFE